MDQPVADIRVFFSYSHADDDFLGGFVSELKSALRLVVKAKSGKVADIFLDREDLGWGVDWRDEIASALRNAFVFMPFVSANFLESQNCRDEFTAFQSQANSLGLDQLILPVLPFETPIISSDSADDIARFTDSRQYKCIEKAVFAGTSSPEWRLMVADLADSLLSAIARAEAAVGPAGGGSLGSPPGDPDSEDLDDGVDLMDLSVRADEAADRLKEVVPEILASAKQLEAALSGFDTGASKPRTSKEGQVVLTGLANRIRQPSVRIGQVGTEFKDVVTEIDVIVRETLRLAYLTNDKSFIDKTRREVAALIQSTRGLADSDASLAATLESMRPLEVLSTPLRKALRPARNGIRALQDGLSMATGWSSLLSE